MHLPFHRILPVLWGFLTFRARAPFHGLVCVALTLNSKILLQEGHEVIACDVKHGPGLEELVHLGSTTMTLDVTDPSSISILKTALADTPVDNLLNVAGEPSLCSYFLYCTGFTIHL